MDTTETPRAAIADALRRLATLGLNRGTAGNISARTADGFLITPSGMKPDVVGPDDIVPMGMDGRVAGARVPSSEWRFHRDIYAHRPDIGAVVHTHAPCSTALAALRRGIPAFHYMIAQAGGVDIRCARYETFGTQALSDAAIEALDGRLACLLANHGMIAAGRDLDRAMSLAVTVEELAEVYGRTLAIGEPVILGEDEMAVVLERFKSYGQDAQKSGGLSG